MADLALLSSAPVAGGGDPKISIAFAPSDDPLLPWLRVIRKALDDLQQDLGSSADQFRNVLEECIRIFSDEERYRSDVRFVKVWILYGDAIQDFERVYRMMEVKGIGQEHSLLYEAYAMFLIAAGKLAEANDALYLGISRNAQPLDELKKIHSMFLDHLASISTKATSDATRDDGRSFTQDKSYINPWSTSTINLLQNKIDARIKKYKGYYKSNKAYSGKVSLVSLQNASRNKIVELGSIKYQIKGCSGLGGYAHVYKAFIDGNPEDVVALKIQKPAFPWEFYMYRQLDLRIPETERLSFGFAHKMHVFSNLSVLVCDYLSHGTLQDAINSYLVMHKLMEEELCIYYTIEMLHMLETLHSVGIIHGDFKPDNLLVRYAREELMEDEFKSRTGPWRNQGLCLIDWGRAIDLKLFPSNTQFQGDCRTSGFRCIEMQENRAWTYQVDTYGLCVIVHMMLHGTYMDIEKKVNQVGSYYQPKSSFKRYWNVNLWKALFSTLLNIPSNDSDVELLKSLRRKFEDYLCGTPQLFNKLKHLLVKQKASLCSA